MKHTRSIFLGFLMVAAAQFVGSGCVGYVGDDGGDYGVVYGGPDVWVHDDVWLNGGGRGWYGHDRGAYVHPDHSRGQAVHKSAPAARPAPSRDRDHHQ